MSGKPQLTDNPEAQQLLLELDEVCEKLTRDEAAVDAISAHRNRLFVQLRRLGVTQRQIAARAKISEPAVAKALRKAEAAEAAGA